MVIKNSMMLGAYSDSEMSSTGDCSLIGLASKATVNGMASQPHIISDFDRRKRKKCELLEEVCISSPKNFITFLLKFFITFIFVSGTFISIPRIS